MLTVVFRVRDAVKPLVFLVDDFNGGRCGQVAFEYVDSMTFKVGLGVVAQDFQGGDNFRCKLHRYHSLRFVGGIDTIEHAKIPRGFCILAKTV